MTTFGLATIVRGWRGLVDVVHRTFSILAQERAKFLSHLPPFLLPCCSIVSMPPNVALDKAFDPGFFALLEEAKIETDKPEDDRKFRKWLVAEDILDIETFVGLAASESMVVTQITVVAETAIGKFPTQGARGKIVTLWRAARAAVDRGEQMTAMVEDGKPIPTSHYASLKQSWKQRHNFVLTAYRILAPVAMSRMWKHCTAKPKQFLLLFPEEMKLKSSIVKTDVGTMQLKPGETPKNAVHDLEGVTGVAMLRDRIEAQFNTWAFVSVQEPGWFELQDVLQLMDTLNELFRRRYRGGSRPTLDFYLKAYLRTMGYFVDQISTHERPLKDVAKAHSEWIHFWTGWEAPTPSPSKWKGTERSANDDAIAEFDSDSAIMGPQIKNSMSQYHTMAKNLANQLRQSQQGLWQAQQKQSSDKGKGKGKGKWQVLNKFQKGKSKGKGKNRPKWSPWNKDRKPRYQW